MKTKRIEFRFTPELPSDYDRVLTPRLKEFTAAIIQKFVTEFYQQPPPASIGANIKAYLEVAQEVGLSNVPLWFVNNEQLIVSDILNLLHQLEAGEPTT